MEQNERLCAKCGKPIGIGMHSLISNLCDDCYEREQYPNIQYSKNSIEQEFYLPDGKYSVLDLFIFLHECEEQIVNKIKNAGINNGQFFACLFYEYDTKEKIKELIRNKYFTLKFSYFFTNNKLNLVPSYEDRNKRKSWIICYNAK